MTGNYVFAWQIGYSGTFRGPFFLDAATGSKFVAPEFFKVLYTYAWFVTFAIGFVLYWLLMLGHPSVAVDTKER